MYAKEKVLVRVLHHVKPHWEQKTHMSTHLLLLHDSPARKKTLGPLYNHMMYSYSSILYNKFFVRTFSKAFKKMEAQCRRVFYGLWIQSCHLVKKALSTERF